MNACESVKWPYAETLDGGEIWVQPLILEGARLEAYFRAGFEYLFHPPGDRRALRFNVDFPARPESTAGGVENGAKPTSVASSVTKNGHEQTGPASL